MRNSTWAPMSARSRPMVRMSRTSGTLVSVTALSVSRAAQTSGREAFLAPEMRTVPSSGLPPTTRICSTEPSLREVGRNGSGGTRRHHDPGYPPQVGDHALDREAFAGADPRDSPGHAPADLDEQAAAGPEQTAGAGGQPPVQAGRIRLREQRAPGLVVTDFRGE